MKKKAPRKESLFFYKDGSVMAERWTVNGVPHRDDGPAIVGYWKDGSVAMEQFHKNGVRTRDCEVGPASIYYYKDGTVSSVDYYKDGVLHNTLGPAVVEYWPNGNLMQETYMENGLFTNSHPSGRAIQSYNIHGEPIEPEEAVYGDTWGQKGANWPSED